MTYYGRPTNGLTFLFVLSFVIGMQYSYVLIVTFFLLIAALCRFELEIDDSIYYRITLYNFLLYEKRIMPDQLSQLKFKRVEWKTKAAMIKVEKGFNVRIINFKPEVVYDDLMKFGYKHDIPVNLTKDYTIIERRNNSNKSFSK